jgi:hypothetical protein
MPSPAIEQPPFPEPPGDQSPPVADFANAPETEPDLLFTLQSEVYAPPDSPAPAIAQNGSQTPLPLDVKSLTTTTDTSTELSLFAQPDPPLTMTEEIIEGDRREVEEEPIDFSEIIARSNLELKRLGWTSEQGRNYLLQTYGKRSRQLLSDEQLIEFLAYLEQQPTPE